MLQPDTHLGTYRLLGRLGAGGMGEVWKAEDTRLGRTVAIKVLPPAMAAEADAMSRLRREARTAAQLYHPNIATIHAFEEAGDQHFLVMEYVEGEPLTELIRRGPMAEADVCRIGKAVADALAEAHAKGIVHRDIKPDNIVVSGSRVKVLDFGIARRTEAEQIGANDPTAFKTATGFIVGTVHYMSPEQALGRPFDARTDIFSLGVVLYFAATKRLPFMGESITETITKIARDEPEPPQGLSPGFEAIVRKCLQKKPEDRYQSAAELAGALDQQLNVAPTAPYTRTFTAPPTEVGQRPTPHRWPWIAGITALVMAGLLSALVLLRPKQQAAVIPPPVPSTTSSAPETVAPVTTTIEVAATEPDELPQPTTTTAVVIEPVNKPPNAEKTADDFYNEGLARLVERQPFRAREAFETAVEKDPTHARAHFRLGEMALFGRDFPQARQELNTALTNGDRLDARERKLTELGLAVLDRDRQRAEELAREITAMSPRDPDLMRFRDLMDRPQDRPFRGRRVRPD